MLSHGALLRVLRFLCLCVLPGLMVCLSGISSGQTADMDRLDPTLKKLIAAPSLAQTPA